MKIQDIINEAVPYVINDMDERITTHYNNGIGRIIFSNGWYASIIHPFDNSVKYSIAVADYNGYFNWNILVPFGTKNGVIFCNTEEEICNALNIIKALKPNYLI